MPDTADAMKTQPPTPVSITSDTSVRSQNALPIRTPRTPGDRAQNVCTLDETQFARVAVHTAKCTECDKRNLDVMRRCPGCTFQVCQPCFQKRHQEGKGLVHGNMPTPGPAVPSGSGVRTARKKPPPSISPTEVYSKKPESNAQEQPVDTAAEEKESDSSTAKPNNRKRPARRTPSESSLEKSTEDSDYTSPIPSKRARTVVSFAESAFATAGEEPPTTRATHRSSLAATHEALTSATLNAVEPQSPAKEPPITRAARRSSLASTHEAIAPASSKTAKTQPTAGRAPSEPPQNDILYHNAIKNYKEPLLARREPITSNPVAHIPAIIKRGGKPKPSAKQIHQNIQEKVREKLNKYKDPVQDPEVLGTAASLFQLAMHSRGLDELQASTAVQSAHIRQAHTVQGHAESSNAATVRGHVSNLQAYAFRNHMHNKPSCSSQHHIESANDLTARKNAEIVAAHALHEHMNNLHTQGHAATTHASHVSGPAASAFHHIPAYTVRDFVRHEAIKYQNNPLLDQDDNAALFNTLQSGALIWGKQTYKKQPPEAQRGLRPGLNLRLDAIDKAYTTELQVLMAEQAARMVQDLIE
ncbi:hypothetical protein yc1106_06795 [Curvularia clavata]|uniref:Uncharacterized protein n=1 Tax=Curvularia clavata TaxID=95742 RepID=A0A9Q9DVK4_CURCL|nr:hypothetical protein yc1106_06795 [Curvularia clavata]